MNRIRKPLAAALLVLLCVSQTVSAPHPFHVSRAEIEYNAKRKTFEVALCVWPIDLEEACSSLSNQRLDIDEMDEKSRNHIFNQYVAQKFRFLPSVDEKKEEQGENGTETEDTKKVLPAPIRWAGSEITLKQAWLYFEVDAKSDAEEWTIENRMFFELHEDQLNLVQIKHQKNVKTLTLSMSEPSTDWSSVDKQETASQSK